MASPLKRPAESADDNEQPVVMAAAQGGTTVEGQLGMRATRRTAWAFRRPAARDGREGGFTLVELLVVMIIIGILAAIAIPVFLSQRAKAHDASTKADINHLGKEVATYFVDGKGTLALDYTSIPGSVVLSDGLGYSETVDLTNGTASPASGAYANLGDEKNWCVSLTDPRGAVKTYKFHAVSGLGSGTC